MHERCIEWPGRAVAAACVFVVVCLGSTGRVCLAHEDHPDPEKARFFDGVEVTDRQDDLVGIATSSSEGTTGQEDLEKRPILRAGEVLETVPGVIATQHSGGGKANQYYLRGFNLDHGTDFSVFVDGMPVNMPTHGHGQGYADMTFVIPELIERVRFRKGPYQAERGDFSAAGGADVDLVRRLPAGILKVTAGSFDHYRAVVGDSVALSGGDLTWGVEGFHDDGPWQRPDDYRRFNGLLSYHKGDAQNGWSVSAMGSDGEWLATDQIPQRAVEQGLIDRYDLIDPGPRGNSSRWSLSGGWHGGGERSITRVTAYAIKYDFQLFSNFTYFLEDPVRGDQFEQVDDRWIFGADLSHHWFGELGGTTVENAVGMQIRHDDTEVGLYKTQDLERFFTTREDAVSQLGAGLWGESLVHLSSKVRLSLGLRVDRYQADVTAYREVNSGSADDWMVSPKLSVAWRTHENLEWYVSAGRGFHSNDARGATIQVDPVGGEEAERVEPLVAAFGVDVGFRVATPTYHGTLTGYWLELDSELVFVGDGGSTEASRPSRRIGLEWTNVWQVAPWVSLDLDLTLNQARFDDDDPAGDHIPGAIESTISGGVSLTGLDRWKGGLRLRWFSGGALVEDDSVRWGPTALLSARVGYDLTDNLSVTLDGFNLLDREDDDIAYFYASRLAGEAPGGVEDVHFHPVEKPAVRMTLEYRF